MTGYSTKENVNNINGYNKIWIDVYQIIEFLRKNKSEVQKENSDSKDYIRKYDILDPVVQD